MVDPRPVKVGCDLATVERTRSVGCLPWTRSVALEEAWALLGLEVVGAVDSLVGVLAEPGRFGTLAVALAIEVGLSDSGMSASLSLAAVGATSSIGFNEETEAELRRCRFELRCKRAGCLGDAGGVGRTLRVGLGESVDG